MLKPCAVIELVWQDRSGSTAITSISAPSSSSVEDIDASASALASILMPLTGCTLIKQRIVYKWVPDEPVVASGGTSIRDTGSFFFSTGEDTAIALIVVRAIKDEFIIETGPGAGIVIDETISDVAAFIDTVIDGIIANVFGDSVEAFITAYKQSRV